MFSAGNVGRVTLERLSTHEILEAELSRSDLEELHLRPADVVGIRFRHIHLFAHCDNGLQRMIEKEKSAIQLVEEEEPQPRSQ